MKIFKLLFSVLLVFATVQNGRSAMQINTDDIPLSVCVGYPGFFDAWLNNYDWSEKSWGIDPLGQRDWAPDQAGVHVRSDMNSLYEIRVRFQFSSEDIEFFNTRRFDGGARIPFALELDIIDFDGLFGYSSENDFRIIRDNLPNGAGLIEDISALDSSNQLSALITRPDNLEHDVLYEIVFQPTGNVASGRVGDIRMVWQVSVNYKWITAMKNSSSSKCDLLESANYLADAVTVGRFTAGYDLVNEYYDDSIPSDAINGWYYFVAAEGDLSKRVSFTTGDGRLNDLVCWDDKIDPNHDNSGLDRCHNMFMATLGEWYFYGNANSSDGCITNPDGGQTCIIGSHTHIIHPDYRCSNNQCWDNNNGDTETNCWDGIAWYEINNGDVYGTRTYRTRDMCAEVYNSGEPDYIPPTVTVIDPGTSDGGGMNDMKIKTVNMSKGSKSTRHSTLYQDPGEDFYAYAKLDNDGTATAYDFKLKFYIDGGKRNTDGDDEDYQDSIRIDEYKPDAKNRYAMELTAPDEPGIYWVYACITSLDNDEDEDNNCSGEDDREEYGKLIVEDPNDMAESSPSTATGKSWDELTSREKAAIMQIIFD